MFFKIKNTLFLCATLIIFSIIYVLTSNQIDPDFGWHYALGEIIVKKGIPQVDPFSYTMPSYPFVDYEWLTNVFFYAIHSTVPQALIVLFSVMPIVALYITISGKVTPFTLAIFTLTSAVLIPRAGIRPQVLGWVLFALFIKLLFVEKLWRKWRFTIPLIIFMWANLHGSFPIAIVILTIFIISNTIQHKKIDFKDIAVLLTSFLTSLLTPYGLRNWHEILIQMSQSSLFRKTILEWYPFYYRMDYGLLALLVLTFCFIVKFRNQLKYSHIAILTLLAAMSMSSIRHASLFVLASSIFLNSHINIFTDLIKKIPFALKRYQIVSKIIATTGLVFIFILGFNLYTTTVNEDSFYPKQAIEYITSNNIKRDRVFALYGWGGYVIWKLPDSKVYIDGRMAGFKWDAPETESGQIFIEYLSIENGDKNWLDLLNKNKPDIVIFPNDNFYKNNQNVLSFISTYFESTENKTENFSLIERLINNGWEIIYKDDISVVLVEKT